MPNDKQQALGKSWGFLEATGGWVSTLEIDVIGLDTYKTWPQAGKPGSIS